MTRGLMIAAPRSGSGKTTTTLGLLRAFKRRGVNVVGLKSGPDYIDPAFHAAASGREGVNLNSWAMPPELLAGLAAASVGRTAASCCAKPPWGCSTAFRRQAAQRRLGRRCGGAWLAGVAGHRCLGARRSRRRRWSRAARAYDPRLGVAGVVVNRVGSERHRRLVVEAIEALGIPVVGALPRNNKVALPERHLGLVQAGETEALDARLEAIADFVEAHVDCDRVLGLAGELALRFARAVAQSRFGRRGSASRSRATRRSRSSTPISCTAGGPPPGDLGCSPLAGSRRRPIATSAGCRAAIPNCTPGGLRRRRVSRGPPPLRRDALAHGECGGYMALGESLVDAAGAEQPVAGLLGVRTSFEKRRMTLGYREARIVSDCALGAPGAVLRGHDFHYATIVASGRDDPFADVRDAYGAPPSPSGSRRGPRHRLVLPSHRGSVKRMQRSSTLLTEMTV